jgi:hypothetical protein
LGLIAHPNGSEPANRDPVSSSRTAQCPLRRLGTAKLFACLTSTAGKRAHPGHHRPAALGPTRTVALGRPHLVALRRKSSGPNGRTRDLRRMVRGKRRAETVRCCSSTRWKKVCRYSAWAPAVGTECFFILFLFNFLSFFLLFYFYCFISMLLFILLFFLFFSFLCFHSYFISFHFLIYFYFFLLISFYFFLASIYSSFFFSF